MKVIRYRTGPAAKVQSDPALEALVPDAIRKMLLAADLQRGDTKVMARHERNAKIVELFDSGSDIKAIQVELSLGKKPVQNALTAAGRTINTR